MPFAANNSRLDALISPMVHKESPSSDPIFVRDVSAWFNKDIDGNPATLSAPAGRQVNDTLWVIKAGFGQSIAAPTGWTAWPAYTNNYLQVFYRLADGTAADDFAINESTTRNVVAQMCAIGNTLGETGLLTNFQGGFLNNRSTGTDTDYDLFAINATGGSEPDHAIAFSFYMREKNAANSGALTIGQGYLANQVGAIAYRQAASPVGDLWVGWDWQYEAKPNSTHAAVTIPYTPLTTFCVETTHTLRYQY